MKHNMWHMVTQLGATPFTMSVGGLIAVWLFVLARSRMRTDQSAGLEAGSPDQQGQGQGRFAWAVWIAAFGIMLCLVTVSKLMYIGWNAGIDILNFTGFSGHAARAGAVMPLFFFMACGPFSMSARRLAFLAGVVVAVLITVSRLEILVHSPSEALSALVLGVIAAALTCRYVTRRRFNSTVPVVLTLILLAFVLIRQGHLNVPTESWLDRIASELSGHAPQTVRPWPLAGPWVWTYPD